MFDIVAALESQFDEVHYLDFIGISSRKARSRSAVSMRTGSTMVLPLPFRKVASEQNA